MKNAFGNLSSILFNSGALIALFSFLSGITYFWNTGEFKIIPSGTYGLVFGIAISVIGFFRARLIRQVIKVQPLIFSLGLVLVFTTDWLIKSYNLFQGPAIRGEIILFTLAVLLSFNYLVKFKDNNRLNLVILVLTALWIISYGYLFISRSQGRLIFADDHATFFYRLQLLKDNFPRIPFYYPLWNAGLDARDFFATGSLNFFLIFSPLIYSVPLELSYNYLVFTLLFILLPLSLFYSCRLLDLDKRIGYISALLSLCINLNWFKWTLKYGTMGFATSCVLAPILISYSIKLYKSPDRFSYWDSVKFAILSTLTLLWSVSGVAMLPVVASSLAFTRKLIRSKAVILTAILILCLNLPWMTIFWNVSRVSNFISSEHKSSEKHVTEKSNDSFSHQRKIIRLAPDQYKEEFFKKLRSNARSTNPVIIILAIPGLFLLPRLAKIILSLSLIWLHFLGLIVSMYKPELELDRMLVLATIVAAIPTSACISTCIDSITKNSTVIHRTAISLLLGFLLTGPLVTGTVIRNRSVEQYNFADDSVANLSEEIAQLNLEGRILFAGCVVHEFSSGHLAPLTIFSGKPMIASSPFHNLWRYKDVIPPEFLRKGDAGKVEYFDLMNVSAILAHDSKEIAYFKNRPSMYIQKQTIGRFVLFERIAYESNYFYQGSGEIIEQQNSTLKLKLNSKNAIIKYRYFPFLESSACQIGEEFVNNDLSLIKLENCPINQEITIQAGNPFKRIFNS